MKNTQQTVEELGWKDGTVAEFLNLSPEESALIEIKLALSRTLARAARPKHDAGAIGRKNSLQSVARGQSRKRAQFGFDGAIGARDFGDGRDASRNRRSFGKGLKLSSVEIQIDLGFVVAPQISSPVPRDNARIVPAKPPDFGRPQTAFVSHADG